MVHKMRNDVVISLSNRHVHLTQEMIEKLYGEGYELTPKKKVGASEFAAEETVTVSGPKGSISKVRVLGPARKYTQVELLKSDCFVLGVDAPLCDTGMVDNAAALTLEGPKGSVFVEHCGIIAKRHLHLGAPVADQYSIKVGDIVSVKVCGERGLVFNNVLVRSGKSDACKMHIDMEEGNAAGISNGTIGEIIVERGT